jgi:hypothetical protein
VIPELIAIALAVAIGFALAARLDPDGPLLGESILLGFGACAGLLFLLSLLHVPWNRWWMIALGVVAAVSVVPRRRQAAALRRPPLILVIVAIPLLGYGLFATAAPLWEFDFLSDWGLKGRVFWIARGIDWQFLEQAAYHATTFSSSFAPSHPDYPPLVPLCFDFFALVRGAWNDQALGLINVAFAAALLLIVHRVARDETLSPLAAAAVTFAMVPLAAVPWIGIGEGPFVAYVTAGLLLMRRNVTAAAVMLGLAAFTKNEGLTLIVAAAIALAVAGRRRDVIRLWPAVVIAAPWLIARAMHRLPTDIVTAGVFGRIAERLANPAPLMQALQQASLGKHLLWIGLLLGIAIAARVLWAGERFVLIALALQLVFYVVAYLATPHDIAWQVRWSWARLVWHLMPALTAVVLTSLAKLAVPAER